MTEGYLAIAVAGRGQDDIVVKYHRLEVGKFEKTTLFLTCGIQGTSYNSVTVEGSSL